MTDFIRKNFQLLFLFSLMMIFFIVGIKEIYKPMIAEGDAYSRVNIAVEQKMINLKFNKYGGTWLPLHFSLYVAALELYDNSLFTPRILTLTFSLASVFSLYFFTLAMEKNKNIALISAILFLFFPLRYYLSTQTLSETTFLFFLITALTFLLYKKLDLKKIILFLLFINFAHGIRYESWFLLPIFWLLIFIKKINLKIKILTILGTLFFPLYWIYLNSTYRGDYLRFFSEKYEVAQNSIIPEYFNLQLSYAAWKNKLIPLLPFPLIFFTLFTLKDYYKSKKIKLEKLIYLLLPFYLIAILILQVFLGTMEWFPTRYLVIPLTFLIPILSSALYKAFIFSINNFKKYSYSGLLKTAPIIIISILFIIEASLSKKYTQLEINDWSLLGTHNQYYSTIQTSEIYIDLVSLITELDKHDIQFLNYFYSSQSRNWLDQSIFYSLKIVGRDYPKDLINDILGESEIFIWEKNPYIDESESINHYKILYENQTYYLLEK